MPKPFIVQSVLNAVRSIPDYQQLRVLDLSCGQGEVLGALHSDGCIVEGTHYRSDDYIVRNPLPVLNLVKIHEDVSLDETLPFESESYDLVIMTEVLEHLPNHFQSLREIVRIIKPNGYLIVATPNTARLHSRVSFLFTGAHKLIRRRIGWDTDLSRLHEYHINPVDFPTYHSLIRLLGLAICSIQCTKVKKRHLYLLLLYPIIWLSSLREYCGPRGHSLFRAGEGDLFRRMTSFPLLCSEQLLVVARKRLE